MRATTACLFAAALALLWAPAVSAETAETTFTDPTGDAGPAGTELGPAASDVDIVEVTLASDEDAQTSVEMEMASFDVRPPDTFYGVAFHVNDSFVFAGYGKAVFPFPPFVHEGYYGCQVADHDHNCTELDGAEVSSGFALELPAAWTPAGQTVEDPMAAVFTEAFAPGASEATWEHVWPANAHDLAEADTDHEVPEPAEDEAHDADATAQSAGSTSDEGASLTSVGAASLGLLGAAGVAVRRLG